MTAIKATKNRPWRVRAHNGAHSRTYRSLRRACMHAVRIDGAVELRGVAWWRQVYKPNADQLRRFIRASLHMWERAERL